MELFNSLRKTNNSSIEASTLLSIQDAQNRLYEALAKHTGWKLLKSQPCLKKTIGDFVFEISFSSSKWNASFECVEVQSYFYLYCKKFDKKLNINSCVGFFQIKPAHETWYDISDEKKLSLATEQICHTLDEHILPLCKNFEEDITGAIIQLANEENFEKYNLSLQLLDVYAGRKYIIKLAQKYVNSLSDIMKQDIEKYKQGDRSKAWMINPSNLKYIIDNDVLEN